MRIDLQGMRAMKMKAVFLAGMMSVALLSGCSGGGGGGGTTTPPPTGGTPTPTPTPTPIPVSDGVFDTEASTARFLTRATFGPSPDQISSLVGSSASDWFQAELQKPASLNLPYVRTFIASPEGRDPDGQISFLGRLSPRASFWVNAVDADDQLRQRMAFALSQILVISNQSNDTLMFFPTTTAAYQDILTRNAFGNYRDLLEEVTYSPAMAEYLTYIQNQKGDPTTGRMPDENYARELLQLFTIGLVELNSDGTPVTDGSGNPVELYTNADITGLAKVFTGLSLDAPDFWFDYENLNPGALTGPLAVFPEFHSDLEKSFLGTTIPAGTGPEESIDLALDAIFNHPNVGPFLGRQLIQRFVTSHPSDEYISRVSAAFDTGSYTLPNGDVVGTNARGDLAATIAAVLMDEEALSESNLTDPSFGKIREPIIRFAHWARAFDAPTDAISRAYPLWFTYQNDLLAQAPYGSSSVFNFYRPGYIAPGTATGEAGLTMPEMQIMNAASIPGYANFMNYFIYGYSVYDGPGEEYFLPDYTEEIALAGDAQALIDHVDALLAYGQLSDETKANMLTLLNYIQIGPDTDPEQNGTLDRVRLAVLLVMTSPEYLVQK